MTRRLLDSLHRRAEERFRTATAQNSTLRSLRGGWLWQVTALIKAHPVLCAFVLLLVNTLLGLSFTCVNQACWSVSARLPWNFDVFPEWNSADLLSILGALWSIQAMIAALIYPIVIAFIAVLLQQRAGTGRRIDAYLDSTSAIPASVSCLMLLGAVALQYVVILYLPKFSAQVLGWIVVDFVWFALNLGFTITFTVRSIAYLRPNAQREAIRRHLVVNVWPREMCFRIANKELEGNDIRSYLCSPGANCFSFNVSARGPGHKVERNLDAGRWLVDINLRPLRWAIQLIALRHRWHIRKQTATNSGYCEKVHPSSLSSPLTLSVKHNYVGTVVLFKADERWPIGWLERRLIRGSFVFQSREPVPFHVVEYVEDAITEACDAVSSSRPVRLDEAIKDLVDIHATVLAIGEAEDPKGLFSNWGTLASWQEFGGSADRDFSAKCLDLFDAAVNGIDSDSYAFGRCAYLGRDLLLRTQWLSSVEVRMSLLRLPTSLNRALSRWWVQTIESDGSRTHSACEAVSLAGRDGATHTEAVRTFVGAWEFIERHGKLCFLPDDPRDWSEFARLAHYYIEHLDQTVIMLVAACYRGDEVTTEWLGSTLQGWLWNLDSQADMIAQLEPSLSGWLTTSIFSKSWEDVVGMCGPSAQARNIFLIALRNYWLDCRCLVVYLCLNEALNCNAAVSFAGKIAGKVLHGLHTMGGGVAIVGNRQLAGSFSDAFIQILRQSVIIPNETDYYNLRLSMLVQRVRHEASVPLVSGRPSIAMGNLDLSSLRKSQALYLAIASRQVSGSSLRVTEYVRHLVRNNIGNNKQQIQILTEALREALEIPLANSLQQALESVCGGPVNMHTAMIRENLREASTEAGLEYQAIVSAMPLSRTRLDSLEAELSAYLLHEPKRAGPLGLFGSVVATSGVAPETRFVVSDDAPKAEFTEPPLTLPMFSQSSNVLGVVLENLGYKGLEDVLSAVQPIVVDASDVHKYVDHLSKAANTLRHGGLTPIVIADIVSLPDWFIGLPNQRQTMILPSDIEITFSRDEAFEQYRCHINGVPVYQVMMGNAGSSFVLARESFSHLYLSQSVDDRVVKALWEPKDGDPTAGRLVVVASITVSASHGVITRLVHRLELLDQIQGSEV